MIDRESKPPGRHWPDRPELVAGLDLLAGGSWLGINDWGVVAAVLNRHGSLGPAANRRSRGELVLEALDHADAAAAAVALSDLDPEAYRTFNLIVADESRRVLAAPRGRSEDRAEAAQGRAVDDRGGRYRRSRDAAHRAGASRLSRVADPRPRSERLGRLGDIARQHAGAAERAGDRGDAVSHRRVWHPVERADGAARAGRVGSGCRYSGSPNGCRMQSPWRDVMEADRGSRR